MSRTTKIIGSFACCGFFLPIALFVYVSFINPYADNLLFYFCPTSIASMALDHSSLATGLIVWFSICLSNAVLYALPPTVILLFVHLFRPIAAPPSILR